MFKQAFRFAFVALIWKQYKAAIISTVAPFSYLFLVSWIHSDYIASAQLENQTAGLGRSFILKWLAFASGVGVYFLFHSVRGRIKRKAKDKPPKTSLMPRSDRPNATNKIINDPELAKDPFAHIRTRNKLRGRKEFDADS
jgi:hypothetical protein